MQQQGAAGQKDCGCSGPTTGTPAAAAAVAEQSTSSHNGTASPGKAQAELSTAASMQLYELGDAAALVSAADNELDDDTWLALMQRNSDPNPEPHPAAYRCPMPQLQVSSLRPRLAQASLLLPAAAAEPQWLRGFGLRGSSNSALWFDAAAWDRVIRMLLLLLTRWAGVRC
jgi:hypothetical protein